MKEIMRQLFPPILWSLLKSAKSFIGKTVKKINIRQNNVKTLNSEQDLEVYWHSKMAESLETWGEGNVWSEIKFLMASCKGKVLDVACGTGKTIEILSTLPYIKVYGCDISDFLIQKAIIRGIQKGRLEVGDATKMNYLDNSFDYAYSIGSLEHFTEEGITECLSECFRVVKKISFHMVPVSRSGKDEGWMKTYQSFHNNSTKWWLNKCNSVYKNVYVLDSSWKDDISEGKWFICIKEEEFDASSV